MPFIQNVAAVDIKNEFHFDPGPNSVLISIIDPKGSRPIPKFPFRKVFNFEFFDLDDDDIEKDNSIESNCITKKQAEEIIAILEEALDNNSNVIVHCMAGVCRSGAIVDVAIKMGFDDLHTFKLPNSRVKRMLLEVLSSKQD